MKRIKPKYSKSLTTGTSGQYYVDVRGKKFLTKFEAQLSSFFRIFTGRLLHGFPVVVSDWFPVSGLSVWPFIFLRKKDGVTTITVNHEMIHCRQQVELYAVVAIPLFIYYCINGLTNYETIICVLVPRIVYLFEYVVRIILYLNFSKAYENHSMEREARFNAPNMNYLFLRKHFCWLRVYALNLKQGSMRQTNKLFK